MSHFPSAPYDDCGEYFGAYAEAVHRAYSSIDRSQIERAAVCLADAISRQAHVYTCGNGGSAAIANHLVCDHVKGVHADTDVRHKVHSLSSNIELITAIANDTSYSEIFAFQLASYAKPGDILIAISSSGNSPNIVRAINWGNANELKTIAMTGFDGGLAAKAAGISLHVNASNYGVVEDAHQSLMHTLAQFLRMQHMRDRALIGQRIF